MTNEEMAKMSKQAASGRIDLRRIVRASLNATLDRLVEMKREGLITPETNVSELSVIINQQLYELSVD